ncbi:MULTISPECIES: nucleotide exchange factor GrpE [unclassified Acinetobacter]|uniref:nucleotide exchange factor GrpE n=1 Tax=unclassified Acinetobacter TaxID=196816 RepID=UPI0035B76492
MFKNLFNRSKNMTEQNPNLEQEQQDGVVQTEATNTEISIDSLQAEIAQLNDDLKLEKARTANAVYEAQKSVERVQRESEKHKEVVLEKFAKALLDSVDNLERAIQATGEEKTALLEGVELTLKSLLSTLEKFGVVAVDTENGFNAEFHQAVGIDPNAKANQIGNVLQKGYTLNGRLLRPAMVMVGA